MSMVNVKELMEGQTKELAAVIVKHEVTSMIEKILQADDTTNMLFVEDWVYDYLEHYDFPEMVEAYADALERKWQKELDAKMADRIEQLQRGEL